MTTRPSSSVADELIDQLADLGSARARASFLRRHRQLCDRAVVDRVYARVVRLARTDLTRAGRLAHAAKWIADTLDDDGCRAQSLRAIGHVHHTRGEYAEALQYYSDARAAFLALGRDVDVARTLNGALQSLISLGRYDEALASADEARAIFSRHENLLGLARLDSNTGNILYRQDRFEEALVLYRRAFEQLQRVGEPQDIAAALSNIAVVHISLNEFDQALTAYHEARALCERHDMPLLTLRADYNIADLHYLRGEYTRALRLYGDVRERSERLGDAYHAALCDLDRSGIYLELNLSDEAAELAEGARARFEQLGMSYEAAKAVTNLALSTSRRGDGRQSHSFFQHARRLFAREGNHVWLALLDFYEAIALVRGGHRARARRLCEGARKRFAQASIPAKEAQCDLLLARLELQSGDVAAAEGACAAAFDKLRTAEAPMLMYQAHCVAGLVYEARGERKEAYEAFQAADRSLEHLRNQLQSDALRLAFLEDKLDVYERLVTTCLAFGGDRTHHEAAFGYIEKAKSRSLADLIAQRAVTLTPRTTGTTGDEVRRCRQELMWHYRQVEQEEMRTDRRSLRRIEGLRARAQSIEKKLVAALDELRRTDAEYSVLQNGTTFDIDEIRQSLPPDSTVLEYYQAMGTLYVCILFNESLEVVTLVTW
jgi:tetratricopeptide (TPR) repeat protein